MIIQQSGVFKKRGDYLFEVRDRRCRIFRVIDGTKVFDLTERVGGIPVDNYSLASGVITAWVLSDLIKMEVITGDEENSKTFYEYHVKLHQELINGMEKFFDEKTDVSVPVELLKNYILG